MLILFYYYSLLLVPVKFNPAAVQHAVDMTFRRNNAETTVMPSPCFDNRSEEFQSNLSKVKFDY